MKRSLSTIALSLFIIQSSLGCQDNNESLEGSSPNHTTSCETPKSELLHHFNVEKSKSDEIKYLHELLSQQAKEIQEKDDKIKSLENVTPNPNVDASPGITPVDSHPAIPIYKPMSEPESGDSIDWPQYRSKEQDKLLEEKYQKSLVNSVESYKQASTLLDTNKLLEDELEQQKEKFQKAKAAHDNANAEKKRQEEARRYKEKQNYTTGKHLEQVGQQVNKEAVRVVHQAGNVGKKIFKKF